MQAAIGCAQLEKFPTFVEKRKANYDRLYESLKDVCTIQIQRPYPESEPSWFGFLMTLTSKASFTRNELAQYLESHNIQTRNLFAGNIIMHPCFDTLQEGIDYRMIGDLTNTNRIMNDSLWIGVYPGMSNEKLEYMIQTIREFCGK